MTGSTASLRTVARRALGGETRLSRGAALLVAVSGGPDSMALLDTMATLAPTFGFSVFAHGVDHGLRAGAAAELDLAEEHARSVGVPFTRTRLVVPRGSNLQARARAARWTALAGAARLRTAAAVATAHHADDRAETLLLRLLRGAGARGLGVMPPRAPLPGAPDLEVVRPLLRARKTDILAHLARRRVAYANDPSNEDPRFLRARVRRELVPLLERLDPGIVAHLAALADELADGAGRPLDPGAELAWTAGLPRATQIALRSLLASGSTDVRVWLPGGLVVSRDARARSAATPLRAKA